ncbi:MAG: hypothetical protein ACOCXK_02500, partial [Rhodosalinus sp.]
KTRQTPRADRASQWCEKSDLHGFLHSDTVARKQGGDGHAMGEAGTEHANAYHPFDRKKSETNFIAGENLSLL